MDYGLDKSPIFVFQFKELKINLSVAKICLTNYWGYKARESKTD